MNAGNVEFFDGGVAIAGCLADPVSSGSATCVIPANTYASIATHTITAQYLGTTSFNQSAVSASIIQVVEGATTTVVVSTTGTPSVVGQPVIYTATALSTSGTPSTGNIEFIDGSTAISACGGATGVAVNPSGVATCTVTTYTATGSHTITAKYLGAINLYQASAASSPITQVWGRRHHLGGRFGHQPLRRRPGGHLHRHRLGHGLGSGTVNAGNVEFFDGVNPICTSAVRRQFGQPIGDPAGPGAGEGDRVVQVARRRGGGDDLPPRRVEPQADAAGPGADPQQDRDPGHFDAVAVGVALAAEKAHARS